MLGAVAGDIIGSPYEWADAKGKDFEMFRSHRGDYKGRLITTHPRFTDETVMTLAVAEWLTKDNDWSVSRLIKIMQELGRDYIDRGFAPKMKQWIESDYPHASFSYGNAAAARVSPIGLLVANLPEAIQLARMCASVTHDHPEAILGAEAIAQAVWLARHGRNKDQIQSAMVQDYGYDFTIKEEDLKTMLGGCLPESMIANGEEIEGLFFRPTGRIDTSASITVPAAIRAFLEGESFEDTVRRAIAYGGDSDTIASMAGAIAGAFYKDGISENIKSSCNTYLDSRLLSIMESFENICLGKSNPKKAASKQNDSFQVVKIGDEKLYLVPPHRKELIAALHDKFGNDIRIVRPSEGMDEVRQKSRQDKSGTYLEKPRPDIRTIFFQNGEFRTSATVTGPRLPAAKIRLQHRQNFFEIREYAARVKKELQQKCGYNGKGSIHFANAYFPVIYHDSVEIWQGDIFAGSVYIDQNNGQLTIEAGGGIGPSEWYDKRTDSVFTNVSFDALKEAIGRVCLDEGLGIDDKNRASNIEVANKDIAESKDKTLLDSIQNNAVQKENVSPKP